MKRVLIAGCGYVGTRLAELLVADGFPGSLDAHAAPAPGSSGASGASGSHTFQVYGLKRDPTTLPPGVIPVAADVGDPGTLSALPGAVDALVYAVAPAGRSEDAYRTAYVDGPRNVLRALAAGGHPPSRFILVSSTGVYGHTDGRWVDEETPPEPADVTGQVLLEGEAVVRDGAGTGVVLRLGGIYGPGRTTTVRRVLAGDAGCPDPDRYGNRIHRHDAAAAIRHLLDLDAPAPVYIGVDRDPAPLRDVYRWIAERGGAPDPCRDETPESWEASGRRGTNKRCSSERLVASGFQFRYPSFREGYAALME
jgi:nucleoside-diphosphate-sugar epimerase